MAAGIRGEDSRSRVRDRFGYGRVTAMPTPEEEIAAFERSTRHRGRFLTVAVILVPVLICVTVLYQCVSKEMRIRAHNEQVQANYERRQEERRKFEEQQANEEMAQRKARLVEERQALDKMLAEAGPAREAAAAAFALALANLADAPVNCSGALTRAELTESFSFPKDTVRAVVGDIDGHIDERMLALAEAAKNNFEPSRRQWDDMPSRVVTQFSDRETASQGRVESLVLNKLANAERAGREEVERGLYPKDMSWVRPAGLELVVLLDVFDMPSLPYDVDLPFDQVREFGSGRASGQAALWSHSQRAILCAARFDAANSDTIRDIKQNYTSVGGVTQADVGNRTIVLRTLVRDFENNVARSIASALGLR